MKSVGKMGKFIKKTKLDGESLALIDVSPSSLGVLTRAKSLALQRRLQKPSSSSSSPSKQKMTTDCGGGSYLQLRSRRLQKKPPIGVIRRRKKQRRVRNPNPNPQNLDSGRGSVGGDGSRSDSVGESVVCGKAKDFNGEINLDELQGSESFNRTTRESTPCSLMRKQETITSPGSSPRFNNGVSDDSNQRDESLSGSRGHLPTTPEMDEFFSGAEEEQQKQFIDKYNFDPVNERPLPGRYEWKKVDD